MTRFRGVAFGPIGAQNLQIGAPWLMDARQPQMAENGGFVRTGRGPALLTERLRLRAWRAPCRLGAVDGECGQGRREPQIISLLSAVPDRLAR
jgi:hypothetical protein